jgi:hypothetical protein
LENGGIAYTRIQPGVRGSIAEYERLQPEFRRYALPPVGLTDEAAANTLRPLIDEQKTFFSRDGESENNKSSLQGGSKG